MTEQLTQIEKDFIKELIQNYTKRHKGFKDNAKQLLERLEK